MRIAEYYSHFNGLEFLLVHKPELLKEIETIISLVIAGEYKTKIIDSIGIIRNLQYNFNEINIAFSQAFKKHDWKESEENYLKKEAGETPIFSYNQTDFVKDRVAVEVQFGKYSFVAYDLFVKHLAFYIGDFIDVGIEILPTKALQKEMSSGVAYYEGEFYNVVRQGRGVPAVPLVLIGIEP